MTKGDAGTSAFPLHFKNRFRTNIVIFLRLAPKVYGVERKELSHRGDLSGN